MFILAKRQIRQAEVTLIGHTGAVEDCAFSADGRQIVSASNDRTLKLWDSRTARELLTLIGHADAVTACAFSLDGSQVLSASRDSTLKLWNALTGQEIATLRRHNGHVTGAFSPDGRYIVSTSWDNTLKLWDARSGLEILHYPAGGRTVAWSPTAALVVVGCANGAVHILQVKNVI